MRVAVIGGHGHVALHVSRILSERGDSVTGIVRNPDHVADVEATGARAVVADVETLTATDIGRVIEGHDAVVWSAGAGGGNPTRTYAVDRDAAIRSIDAAVTVGVERFVMVSYLGAGPDHGVPSDSSFFPYAEAKAAADAHLRESSLNWTILGPSRLTFDPGTGSIEVGDDLAHGEVPREDVAAVLAAVLADTTTIGRTIDFNTGDTPIADAIHGS